MIALLLAVVLADGPVTVTKIEEPARALRFEVIVPAPVDEVWTAFATTEGLATWLWRDVRVDARPGGDWLVLYPGGKTGGGTIVSINPKQQIVIAALAPEQFPTVRATRTRATFEFSAVSPTSTRVTLLQTGWQSGAEWDAAYNYLADGNAQLLTQLHKRFVSGPAKWPER